MLLGIYMYICIEVDKLPDINTQKYQIEESSIPIYSFDFLFDFPYATFKRYISHFINVLTSSFASEIATTEKPPLIKPRHVRLANTE